MKKVYSESEQILNETKIHSEKKGDVSTKSKRRLVIPLGRFGLKI